MRFTFARSTGPVVTQAAAFTLRGTLTVYGKQLAQTQFVTERYVITQVEQGMFIFLLDRDERLLVDRGADRLRRVEPHAQRIQLDRLRAVIGDVRVVRGTGHVRVGSYACRRYGFSNSNARVVIEGETLATPIPGVERTALHAERDHDARAQPFALPLDPDEVVVESRLRTIASDFEQNQSYRLESIAPGVVDLPAYDRIARLAVIG